MYAAQFGCFELVSLLVENGANIDIVNAVNYCLYFVIILIYFLFNFILGRINCNSIKFK